MRGLTVALLLCLTGSALTSIGAADDPRATLPAVDTVAPRFTLTDASTGKARSLESFSRAHRPVALFFFCGCSWCAEVAREWALLQRGDALPAGTATVIVYQSGEAAEARGLVQRSGMDAKRTAVLLDGDRAMTDALYHADPCPRVFVLDGRGRVRYVNTAPDEQPRVAPAALLTGRALAALGKVTRHETP